jgi:DNA-binding Lrp family transcriptional regulator
MQNYKFSEKELLILLELRKNSRQSLAEISRRTNIPISTVFDKMMRLNDCIVKKNISLYDFGMMGYGIQVNFFIKCVRKREINDYLFNNIYVNSVSRINNGSDFFVECFFKDMAELERFNEELQRFGIEELKQHHIVEEIKKEEFFTKRAHMKMVAMHILRND